MKSKTASYAMSLAKTLIKHSNDEELTHLIRLMELEKRRLCESRPNQGLNDASYHLYCKYFL